MEMTKQELNKYLCLDYSDDTPFVVTFEDGALNLTSSTFVFKDDYSIIENVLIEKNAVIYLPHSKGVYRIPRNVADSGVFTVISLTEKEAWYSSVIEKLVDLGYSDKEVKTKFIELTYKEGMSVDEAIEYIVSSL